ncbi:hypothetical protein ScPMuIL_000935 [Solemya velum]
MADDIDDLLDEVETKFCTSEQNKKKTQNKTFGNRTVRKKDDEEIQSIIDDIIEDRFLDGELEKVTSGPVQIRPKASNKCFPIYLGGSNESQGFANGLTKRTCDKLRCTGCDFRVLMFDDFKWYADTDYLFLRNNVPDFHRLKSNLIVFPGSRAYCCQCSWRSQVDLTELKDPRLKWVCGKH